MRFTPLSLSLDELSKVWSVFFQTPYLLSVAYQASVVLIETDDAPTAALPVKTRTLDVVPFRHPMIERISAPDGEGTPIFSTSALRDRRSAVPRRRDVRAVRRRRDRSQVADRTERSVRFRPDTRAGVHALQVLQKQLMGAGAGTLHRGFESNVATFVLRPKFDHATLPAAQRGRCAASDVDVADDQRVALVLDSTDSAKPRRSVCYQGNEQPVRRRS